MLNYHLLILQDHCFHWDKNNQRPVMMSNGWKTWGKNKNKVRVKK